MQDQDWAIAYINRYIAEHYAGNQAQFAKANEMSPAYVSDVLNFRRDPGKKILDAVGLEKTTVYRIKV